MNVAHNGYRGCHRLHVALLNKDVFDKLAADTEVAFGKALALVKLI